MSSGSPDVKLVMASMESAMEQIYLESGGNVRVFWLEQFMRVDQIDARTIGAALRGLARAGRIVQEAILYCENGHTLWAGDLVELKDYARMACRECSEPDDVESRYVETRICMTPTWIELLDREAEKKTPASAAS